MQTHLTRAWEIYGPKAKTLGVAGISSSASAAPTVAEQLVLFRDAKILVAFAPFKTPDMLCARLKTARILFVGLTPGRHQARLALQVMLSPSPSGKEPVSFAGPMRRHLIKMLDTIGIPACFNIPTSASLFTAEASHLACSTSLLRFPVFMGSAQKNFSGTATRIERHPFLHRMVDELFMPLANDIQHPCLVVPMGKAVEPFCVQLSAHSRFAFVLRGFPHPSGGDGHRVRLFAENVESLTAQVRQFAAKL